MTKGSAVQLQSLKFTITSPTVHLHLSQRKTLADNILFFYVRPMSSRNLHYKKKLKHQTTWITFQGMLSLGFMDSKMSIFVSVSLIVCLLNSFFPLEL